MEIVKNSRPWPFAIRSKHMVVYVCVCGPLLWHYHIINTKISSSIDGNVVFPWVDFVADRRRHTSNCLCQQERDRTNGWVWIRNKKRNGLWSKSFFPISFFPFPSFSLLLLGPISFSLFLSIHSVVVCLLSYKNQKKKKGIKFYLKKQSQK